MILDPCYKIHGFTQMQWEPHWITTAKRQFEAVFKAQYAISVDSTLENTGTNLLALPTPPVSFDEDDDIAFTFGVPVARVAEIVRETKEYLCEATEPHDVNVLHWWTLHAHRYPQLGKMAKDYLSIPATSVPSDQVFSQAGDIITKKTNRIMETSSSLLLFTSRLCQADIDDCEQKHFEGGEDFGRAGQGSSDCDGHVAEGADSGEEADLEE